MDGVCNAALFYELLDSDSAIQGGWIWWRTLLHLYWYIAIPGCDTISAFLISNLFFCATLIVVAGLLPKMRACCRARSDAEV